MAIETESSVNLAAAPLAFRSFDISSPDVCLRESVNSFQLRSIAKQRTIYRYVFSAIPTDNAAQIIYIVNKAPEYNSNVILKRVRTPSQLLCYMQSLACETKVDDTILRQLFMKYLPVRTAACLATSTYRRTLDKFAGTADKLQKLYDRPRAHAVEGPASNLATPHRLEFLNRLM
ncbi:hypothetical protein ACTXT7_014629 [Hymenolepis weldensis]